MTQSLKGLSRTNKCGELTKNNVGEQVVLMGWVLAIRNLGSLSFVSLRDVAGSVQVVFNSENLQEEQNQKVATLKYEYVIAVRGKVALRAPSNINPKENTGEIEVIASEIIILNKSQTLPFMLEGKNIGNENLRLEYRYLDIRRRELTNNLILRSKATKSIRDSLSEQGFYEIETPFLGKSTPEGARDYLVPSRVHEGKFYALPQSPQMYKQLLMVGGMDRYYQIAKCFRDEDLRADRQPEFTQVDIEMSFVDSKEQVFEVAEKMIQKLFYDTIGYKVALPIAQMDYKEALESYGSDKPDLRFGLKLLDLTTILNKVDFEPFSQVQKLEGSIRAINVKGKNEEITRKMLDKFTDLVKLHKAKNLFVIRYSEEGLVTSLSKFLTFEVLQQIKKETNLEQGDILFIVADTKNEITCKSLGALRLEVATKFELIDKNLYNFTWVHNFPMFEYSEEDTRYYAAHHPFTSPKDEDLHLLFTSPLSVRAKAYDLIINGQEAGGGSIRISNPEIQEEVFEALSFTSEQIKEQFGFFIQAFNYGTPPHGGIAFGLDRLVMLLAKTDNIKDVIAFPKIQNATCLMTKAPGEVSKKQLDELSISIKKSVKNL